MSGPAWTKGKDVQTLREVRRPRISDEVIVQLANLILSGTYSAGEKLPAEREMALQLGVNRTSLREALRRMETMGLVQVRPGDGVLVLDVDLNAGLEFVSFLVINGMNLDSDMILSLAEVRKVFAVPLIEMAANRKDKAAIDALQKAVDEYPRGDSPERFTGKQDFEFYQKLAMATGNKVFVYMINSIRDVFEKLSVVFYQMQSSPDVAVGLYAELVDAIRKGNGKKAVEIFMKQARSDDQILKAMLGGQQ